MRALTYLFAGLALNLVACGASEPPVETPPPVSPAPPVSAAAAAPATADAMASAAPTAIATAAPVATAAPEAAKPASPCPANMVLVSGGTFTLKQPKHEAKVAAFCMDVNETTADEYSACVKAGKCTGNNLKCAAQATYETPGSGNHPINCVDFEQANAYCKAQSKRLSTEEEWEWAARGGEKATTFPWGNEKPNGKLCWSGESALVGTCAVGATPAGDSPLGIHDLAGNVYEWTTAITDNAGPMRIGRGGSWRESGPEGIKVTRRGPGFEVTYRCGFLGIRCVSEPAKP